MKNTVLLLMVFSIGWFQFVNGRLAQVCFPRIGNVQYFLLHASLTPGRHWSLWRKQSIPEPPFAIYSEK